MPCKGVRDPWGSRDAPLKPASLSWEIGAYCMCQTTCYLGYESNHWNYGRHFPFIVIVTSDSSLKIYFFLPGS